MINFNPSATPINTPDGKNIKVAKTSSDFEAIFLRQILNSSNSTDSESMKTIKEMYNGEISKELSRGSGVGLADVMYKQLIKGYNGY
jgi:Rod binding domain-containing protein